MELSKKAAKFTKIIASKLKDVIEEDCDKESLKDIFRTAVKSIKKKQIQQEIEKNKEKYLKKLEKHLKVLRNGKQNREKNNARKTSFPCNLYRIETVNKDELEGKDEKLVNFLISERINENLDLMNVGEDSEKYCKGFPELSKYHRVLRLNLEGSLEILKVTLINYFGKIQKLSEEVIQNEDKERASELAEEIKGFVCTCHLQKQRYSQTEDDVIRPTYNDTLASLLSIYLDLMIITCIIYRDNELPKKKGQHLYGYVAYMLPWINQLCILLELTTVTEKDTKLVLPFVKSCLKWRPETTDNPTYLHYILAVRAMHSKLGTHVQNIVEETKAIAAPKGFLKWLSTQDSELVEEFPDDKKFKGRAVTRFLLDDLTEDQEESLINVLVDYGGECQQETKTNEDKNSAETDNVTDGDKVDDLFFIDSGPNKMENSELFFLDKGSGSHAKTDEKNHSEDPDSVSMETDQQIEEMQTEVFVIDTDKFQQQNNQTELSDEEESSRKQSKKKSRKLSKATLNEQSLQDTSASQLTQQDVQSKMLSPVIDMESGSAIPSSNLDISSIENIEPITTGSKTKKSYSLRNRKSTKESEELVYNSFDESDGEDIEAVPDITKHMKPAPNESMSENVDSISKSSSLTKIKSKMDSVVESAKDTNEEGISDSSVKLRKTRSTRRESRSTLKDTRSPINKSTLSQESDSNLKSSASTKKSSKKTRSPSKPASDVKKNMDYINKRLNLTDVDEQLSTPRSSRKRKSSIVDSPQRGSVSETAKSDRSVRRKLIDGKILDQNVTIESCDTDEDDSTTKSRTSHSKRDKIDTPESSKNLRKSKERGMTLRQRQL